MKIAIENSNEDDDININQTAHYLFKKYTLHTNGNYIFLHNVISDRDVFMCALIIIEAQSDDIHSIEMVSSRTYDLFARN